MVMEGEGACLPEPAVVQRVLLGWPGVTVLVRSQRTGLFSEREICLNIAR